MKLFCNLNLFQPETKTKILNYEKNSKVILLRILALFILVLFISTSQKGTNVYFDNLEILSKIKTLDGFTVTETMHQIRFQFDKIQPSNYIIYITSGSQE